MSCRFGFLLFIGCLAPTTAWGQDTVVTAGRSGERPRDDVPGAISVVEGDAIAAKGIVDLRDLALPELAVTQTGPFAQIYLRGVGSGNVFGGSESSIVMQLDGVSLARPASYLADFLDLERIEVLSGPQSTLYGRNAIGGVINLVSRTPAETQEATARVGIGNYGGLSGAMRISGPIATGLTASVAATGTRHDAFLKNIVGTGDVDDERSFGVRAQLRAVPVAGLTATVRLDYARSDDAAAGNAKAIQPTLDPRANAVLGDLRKVALNFPTTAIRGSRGIALENTLRIGGATVRAITAWRASQIDYTTDSDATALDQRRTMQGEEQRQFSQEVMASGNDGALHWLTGAYHFRETIHVDAILDRIGIDRRQYTPLVRTRADAVYGSATLAASDRLSLSAGLRYSDETKRFDQEVRLRSLPGEVLLPGYPVRYARTGRYRSSSPRAGIEYRPIGGLLAYATLARGFKSGGYNFSSEDPGQGFDPERLWSVESGVKARLADGAGVLRAAAFGYDYRGLQVLTSPAPGVSIITNAAVARITGAEFEADLRLARWFRSGASLSLLDARYRRYADAPVTGGTIDAAGKRLNLAPEFSASGYGEARVGAFAARVEGIYRSRQYFTPANQSPSDQQGYVLVHASLAYAVPGRAMRVLGYVRNLTDAAFVTSTAGYGAGVSAHVGAPRRFGLQVEREF